MSLFANTMVPGAAVGPVEVPGFWRDCGGGRLSPIAFVPPVIPSPADQNIQPAEGDDITAPNATTAARVNRVVCVSSANVGYSKAAKDTNVRPSALEYDAIVEEAVGQNDFSLTLRMVLEFESSFPEEGMVVWLKKHQQMINDEELSELMLVETLFEDCVNGQWVPISTDVRYAEEAEAVVQAVITSDSGQTAGRVTTEGAVEDAKLGPVGERGRIVLTYRCDRLYAYREMGLGAAPASRTLVPLALQLPWAAIDNPASKCSLRMSVRAPGGTTLLDPQQHVLAYRDLQRSFAAQGGEEARAQSAILPEAVAQASDGSAGWQFQRGHLPPRPTAVLAWLSVPDAVDSSWEEVAAALPGGTRARVLLAKGEDARFLRVPQLGGGDAHLVRCRVETGAPPRQPNSIKVHTDITITDASGSTGMTVGQGVSVREMFNKHEERRILKRLEVIPKLRQAGLLLDNDVWCQLFVVFDHGVRAQASIETRVGDLDATTVERLVRALAAADSGAASELDGAGKGALLVSWRQMLQTLRGMRAGGATSFIAGANAATESYTRSIKRKFRAAELSAYVNFDTDGGNNCGPCYDAIAKLVGECDVVQGHVLGVGAWVDQDCAAKVAKLLKGSSSLGVSFPDDAAADELFRQDLSRWIKVLRSCPVTLTVSAGSTAWAARHGQRSENGVEVLFAEAEGVRFDTPDVSDTSCTKAVLRGLQAGESVTLYMLSRLPLEQLLPALSIDIGGVRAQVSTGPEHTLGIALGHRWLSMLGAESSTGCVANKATLCGRLRQRLEDDLSFMWNLPTKSGSTAAVGRARTQQRSPVPLEQQPAEPEAPQLISESATSAWDTWGSLEGCSRGGGRFKACCAPPRPIVRQAQQGFATPQPQQQQAQQGFATPQLAMQQQSRSCSTMSARASTCGGGRPTASRSLVKAKRAAAPRFGAGAGGLGKRRCRGMMEADPFAGGDRAAGPAGPSRLLYCCGFMRWGQAESPRVAVERGVRAAKHLANCAIQAMTQMQTIAGPPKSQAEDPLVAAFLGGGSLLPNRGGGGGGGLAVHSGYVCDATGAEPLTGTRFKATSLFDLDITEQSRRGGNVAGGAGFKAIATSDVAMKWMLGAVLTWWQLIWKSRADLFQATPPDLNALGAGALCQAILNLPEGMPGGNEF